MSSPVRTTSPPRRAFGTSFGRSMGLDALPRSSTTSATNLQPPVAVPNCANPLPDSLHDAFAAQARAHPLRIAVSASGQQLSYGELDGRSSRLAKGLRRRGVQLESCVGLCAD